MRSVVSSSSRYAYLFVSVNLVVLLGFLVSTSLSLREVDAAGDRYEGLVRGWFALRLSLSENPSTTARMSALDEFHDQVEAFVSSDLIRAAARLSDSLATASERVHDSWALLRSSLERSVGATRIDSSASVLHGRILDFQVDLLGLEVVLDEFVDLQQRALQILLSFLGGIILATIGIFFLVEHEAGRERRIAVKVRSLAQNTIEARERERARLSRLLHDSLAQELSVALLDVGELGELAGSEENRTAAVVLRLRARLHGAVEWVRDVAHELHPSEIDEIGLSGALRAYCSELAGASPAELSWRISDDACNVPREAAINVYRIAQEALTNAMRHARARHVALRLASDGDLFQLTVSDDGVGFRTDGARSSREPRGIGLIGMSERASILNGELRVDSAPGAGTVVSLSVPLSTLGCLEAP